MLILLKPLNAFQHTAIRFITADRYRTHRCELYEKVEKLSLASKMHLRTRVFIYKGLVI